MKNIICLTSTPVKKVFGTLLKDLSTGKNIIFATDAYGDFRFTTEITEKKLSSIEIFQRAMKSLDEQTRRTRKSAEVFTPAWLCNKMNNFADCEWFGNKDVFNSETGKGWSTKKTTVHFPENKLWKDYVLLRILEITCGEAPFLVSRYDAATGELIPTENRIGVLDRKLRVIGENTKTQQEWNKWVYRAFESVYGYEYQGDSLLIARINLIETFCEYTRTRWNTEPSDASLRRIADIISKNIWQMDGLCGIVPNPDAVYLENDGKDEPFLLSDNTDFWGKDIAAAYSIPPDAVDCEIYDWKEKRKLKYKDLKIGGNSMKFDFIIGNPPFQEEKKDTSDPPIYHLFMDEAYKIADKVELVTPARFLFNAGKTPKAWNKKMLEDKHLKVLYYTPSSAEVFTNTDIRGGATITYRDKTSEFSPIGFFTALPELNAIKSKVTSYKDFKTLDDCIFLQNKFNLTEVYGDFPELRSKIGSGGKEKRLTTSIFSFSELFSDSPFEGSVKILGLIGKNERCYKYIAEKYLDESFGNLLGYKVILPKSNGSGTIGEVLSTPLVGEPLVGEPLVGYTQSFIGFCNFRTKNEAEALLKYIKTKFARTLLGVLKITQDNNPGTWKYVPLQDFTAASDIDWTKSVAEIDRQLYKKYDLSEKEIRFIETRVKEMV